MSRGVVVLTGATGFFGSHLLRALVAREYRVVILKRSTSDVRRIADLLDRVESHDVDRVPLRRVLGGGVYAVIHSATAYGRRGESTSEMAQSNVVFPLQLLELAAESGAKAFLNTDSFSARTGTLPEQLTEYALTKRQFRELASLAAATRGLRFVSLVVEHMYGPGDAQTKFIPSAIRAFLANEPAFELTPGEQRRDFVFVDDVVQAFLAVLGALEALPAGATMIDVGTGTSHRLRDAIEMLHGLCGSATRLDFGALPYRKGDTMDSRADTSVLRSLGWTPSVALRDGFARTLAAARDVDEQPAAVKA